MQFAAEEDKLAQKRVYNKSHRVPVRALVLGAWPVPASFLIYNHLFTLGHL